MALHTIPNELLLEFSRWLSDQQLKNLVQTHPNIHIFLQPELHKRAIRDRCQCDHDSADYRGAYDLTCEYEPPYAHTFKPALHWAIAWERRRLVEYLVRHKVGCRVDDGHWPALDCLIDSIEHPACMSENYPTEIVISVLQHAQRLGKNRNISKSQFTRLLEDWLCRHCLYPHFIGYSSYIPKLEVKVVKMLFQLGVHPMDPSNSGAHMPFAPRVSTTSPIPHMFRVQNPRLLRIFIKHGADLNWTTPEGENILHFAVKMMDHAMVKALLEMGMDADVGGNNNLFNPLHRAITGEDHDNSIEKRRMIVELLLEHGANPNIPSPSKEFALHKILAKFYGDSYKGLNRDHFDVLVARCQHINARDTQGKTALHILMEQRKRVRNNGSCLWYAKILIEAGADPSLVDSTGYPPFHSGIRKSKFGIGNFTITPEWRDLWWTPNDIYQRLHLATYYALKQGRVDWIPARVVYQQAYSEHVLKKCPAAYAWPALPHIRAETVQIFLDVMHALGSFPWRGGPAGVMFRAFWEKHREEITAPLPQSYQGNYNYRDWKETWAHWPAWNVEEWAKWREDQEWMRNDR